MRFSDDEKSLLIATTSPDKAAALAAWHYWSQHTDLDTLPGVQYPLLPKLYSNLSRFGLADGLDGRVKGIYRRTWVRAQQQHALAGTLLPLLADAGSPALLSGDAAASLELYPQCGERTVERLAFVIDDTALNSATQALQSAGWRSVLDPTVLAKPSLCRWLMEAPFRHAVHPSLVLRWRITSMAPPTSRVPGLLDSVAVPDRTPARTNRAALMVAAGEQCAQGGQGRLIAATDLAMALQAEGGNDWEAVIALAGLARAVQPLMEALSAVSDFVTSKSPPEVIERLSHSAENESSYPILDSTDEQATFHLLGWVNFHRRRWQWLARADGVRPTPSTWLEYVQAVSGAPRVVDLPSSLVGRFAQRRCYPT